MERRSYEPPTLAWVEASLPGDSPAERLALAARHGLALEVACGGEARLDELRGAGCPIATVQAYRMHALHPLCATDEEVRGARAHVLAAIEMAHALGAPRVLTVCGFGPEAPRDAPERCRAFFDELAPRARERGVRLLIELLSPRRAAAMTAPEDLARLLRELDGPDVFGAAFDTGHLLDAGRDPAEVLRAWPHAIDELQLRGPDASPPAPGMPVREWWEAARRPAAVVVEHARREELDLEGLVPALRRALAADR